MPEYRRFIAYFYEYIDGKRRRNAGFVKMEQRNGIWRLKVQLRSERWPGERLQIFGYVREQEEYSTVWLGNGYPQKDSMIQNLQIRSESLRIGFERLTGMWIPCEENRCFISNWEETEVQVYRLSLPSLISGDEEREAAESQSEENETTESEAKEREAEEHEVPEAEAEEHEVPSSSKETDGIVAEECLVEAMECVPLEGDKGEEVEESKPGSAEENDREAEKKRQEMENAWYTLTQRCRHFRPFAGAEFSECVRICPRDVIWLGQQQWPVGRNSFLMQGFYHYRHLLLARKADGTFVLGVPGRMIPQNRSIAASFGFENFLTANNGPGYPEGFGYWYRQISI